MRASLFLLATLAACSNSSGPRQLPVLTTQFTPVLNTDHDASWAVTLTATNPTDTIIVLDVASTVFVEVKQDGQWHAGSLPTDNFQGAEQLGVPPGGALTVVGSVNVDFNGAPAGPGSESFTLAPGAYSFRACVLTAESPNLPGICGNAVKFTVSS